mgnify:CR=1 FL=1|tara:strand:+ start:8173 stop:9708 length:1536 start_codon:yes stop_codon:yes gene_type:complete
MLQIVLAIIGLSVVSAIGFITIEQFSIMNRMQEQRENTRRLDIAVEGLQGALGRLPGIDTLVAPSPGTGTGVSWSVMPDDAGAMNMTVSGVPFLYCPVATLSSEELDSISGKNVSSIQMPSSNYAIQTAGRYVVGSSLAMDAQLEAYAPVAFIVAAGTLAEEPGDCSDITVQNGKVVIPGGQVRVVSMPTGVASTGTGAEASAEIWTVENGAGNGTQGSPASLNSALEHFVRYKPGSMTIHVVGENFVSPTTWSRFAQASASSSSKLRIVGHDGGIVDFGTSGRWDVPSSTFLENVTIKGPRVVAGTGDTIFNLQSVGYVTYSGENAAIEVGIGGRFVADNATVAVSNPGQTGVISLGDVEFRNSSLVPVGGLYRLASIGPGSSLSLVQSILGGSGARTTVAPIYSYGSGADFISSDVNSSVFAGSDGLCWNSASPDDMMFTWSGVPGSSSHSGQRSAVVAESAYTRPAMPPAGSDATVMAAYDAQLAAYYEGYNERVRARRVNGSNFACG